MKRNFAATLIALALLSPPAFAHDGTSGADGGSKHKTSGKHSGASATPTFSATPTASATPSEEETTTLPKTDIEDTVEAQGSVHNGVLKIPIARDDIGKVFGPKGKRIFFTPDFGIHGDLYFQPAADDQALLNADIALTESEVNPFISAIIQNGLIFQAYHHHTPSHPQVWFVHFRGLGDPLVLARAVRASLNSTGTPLPQKAPQNPTTSLDVTRLEQILNGHAEVGDNGVVEVTVPRTDAITIDGTAVSPDAGISTVIEFKPIGHKHGANSFVAAMPDFSMIAAEVQPVVQLMRIQLGWEQGCLYNQETGELPQLYFDHMLKKGDAYALAAEIRRGLDLTATAKASTSGVTPTPSPTVSASASPSASPSPTSSESPSPSMTPSPSESPSASPSVSPSESPSASPTPSVSASESPSATPTPSVSESPSMTPTPMM